MIQNSRIVRFVISFFLPVAVVATSCVWAADAFSQIVNSAAFDKSAGHSILEVADEEETTSAETKAAQFSSAPATKIAQNDSAYDAPVAPRPRMTGAKPLAPNEVTFEGNSQGTFTSSNPTNESANNRKAGNHVSPLQPSRNVNGLRASSLRPAPQIQTQHQPQRLSSSSSVSSFSDTSSQTSNGSSGFASSTAVATKAASSTTTVYSQTSVQDQKEDRAEEPKYESAYLHDQQPQRDTPVEDLFRSPPNSHPLPSTVERPKASRGEENFQVREKNFVQQTAFLSPAAPAQPQFQSSAPQQNNRQFGQPQANRRGQRNQPAQMASRDQRTRQRDLPRQNQSQSGHPQQAQSQTTDSTAAKQTIAKFSFDANQQLAEGLPIRLRDILQQSAGRVSRSQLIPQYWEVYYDWAQSVSAKHHLDWVGSLSSAQRNDASSIEIAKSNAQNEITFTAIQLGKSQAKMKSLTGNAQPIVPMDSPTVTRVKTNYSAFKNRGMIAPKYEGIDATLKQMHELIASRANTVTMAQKNADEAQQLYARNQSTVDHVLSAGRTWRAAESDFIASVVEYNKAYADYALALPYGRGPIETVVNMLIVKPATNQNVSGQAANGRPNLSNNAGSNLASQNSQSGNDYSIPYSGNTSNQQNGRSAQSLQTQRSQQSNAPQPSRGHMRHASDTTGPRPDGPSDTGQASARNLMQNARQEANVRPAAQPTAGFNAGGQASTGRANGNVMTERSSAGTSLVKQPSKFPTQQQPAAANPFSSSASSQGPATSQPKQPAQKPFQARPSTQPPVGDRTATRPSPFTPAGSASGASSAPAATPKQPARSGGFNFGG